MRGRTRIAALAAAGLAASTALAAGEATGGEQITHRMMMLVLQLGVILFAARLGHMFAERMRLPGVMGELLAGVAIGPYLLGGFALPGFPDGVFPCAGSFPVSPELYGLCAVASVVLLFMVGLETDIRLFMRYSVAGSMVGIGGVAVSFLFGDLVTMAFSRLLFGRPLGFLAPPCLFMGIVSTATSVGITARILTERHKMNSPEGVTILTGAVVDDVIGIVLLAAGLGVISASRGSGGIDWGHVSVMAAKAVATWVAATAVGLLASMRIGLLLKWFGDRTSIAVMALGLALILAGLFQEAGLAMIIGAYVMGLSLARTDVNQVIRERLNFLYAFLVPVFFTVMGMLVDLRLLASPKVLLFGAVYALCANAAKILGGGIPALLCNFNLRGAFRIGVGMLPRGEVTLIMAGIGLALGAVSPELFGVIVLMLLATTFVAPPAMAALFSHPGDGLRRPVAVPRGETLSFNFPSAQTAELLVGKLFSVFESEGFFVHSLHHGQRLYQLRKDGIVIGFRHSGADIVFECRKEEIPFVNTAMYEVVAELEQTVSCASRWTRTPSRVACRRPCRERTAAPRWRRTSPRPCWRRP